MCQLIAPLELCSFCLDLCLQPLSLLFDIEFMYLLICILMCQLIAIASWSGDIPAIQIPNQ